MTAIVDIIGREILDSRGNPTVEDDVVLDDGSKGRAAVPFTLSSPCPSSTPKSLRSHTSPAARIVRSRPTEAIGPAGPWSAKKSGPLAPTIDDSIRKSRL